MNTNGGRPIFSRVLDVFRVEGKWCWPIVIAFLAIQLIILYNAIRHDPRFGYDAPAHIAYVRTLAQGRLPTPEDSHEFFSPPLPYVPAAIAWRVLDSSLNDTRQIAALKVGQGVHVLASIVVCWCVLAIAKRVSKDRWIGVASLACLGIVPAYYRTFAMVRGEPIMIAMLLAGWCSVLRLYTMDRPTVRGAILAGVLLGGAILSRQWAFFALPAIGLVGLWRLIVDRERRAAILTTGVVLLASTAVVGGWYYAHLRFEYGTMRAFNRAPDEDESEAVVPTPSNQLLSSMVHAPVRDAFDKHPLWLFYSDLWGDYWNYFSTFARDNKGRLVKAVLIERTVASGKSKANNIHTMPAYLGRVCVVSIFPTVMMLGGIAYGLWQMRKLRVEYIVEVRSQLDPSPNPSRKGRGVEVSKLILSVVALGVVFTLIGYSWFVATYPNEHLDTVKATYPLQIVPLIAIATAAMWCALRQRLPHLAMGIGVCVLIILAHNAATFFTRYTLF